MPETTSSTTWTREWNTCRARVRGLIKTLCHRNPGVLQVLTCPALVAAVGSLLGPDWAIVPYANSTIEADAGDQHWHK